MFPVEKNRPAVSDRHGRSFPRPCKIKGFSPFLKPVPSPRPRGRQEWWLVGGKGNPSASARGVPLPPRPPIPSPARFFQGDEECGRYFLAPFVYNFSLKRVAFQTIRPVVSRKKRGFSGSLWAGRRCAAASRFTFFKAKKLRLHCRTPPARPGDGSRRKAPARPHRPICLNKARWGGKGGSLRGEGEPSCALAKGFPFPPQLFPFFLLHVSPRGGPAARRGLQGGRR